MLELPIIAQNAAKPMRRLPPWLKRPLPVGKTFADTRRIVADSGVATVCEEARCPNLSECWSAGTATFMILGDKCTRRCHYCAVETAKPDPPEVDEPLRLGRAAAQMDLSHVVITSVARDDLPDEGAGHFAECVRQIRHACSSTTVEVLPADLHARPELVATLCDAEPDIYNHNIETVERLTPAIRPQGKYHRSLEVLRLVKEVSPDMLTKSGIMVGLGESQEEVIGTFEDLAEVGCDVLTVGQYLQPTPQHVPIDRFYHPDEFDKLAKVAEALGFLSVASGPFVRSSYNAGKVFERTRAARLTAAGKPDTSSSTD